MIYLPAGVQTEVILNIKKPGQIMSLILTEVLQNLSYWLRFYSIILFGNNTFRLGIITGPVPNNIKHVVSDELPQEN